VADSEVDKDRNWGNSDDNMKREEDSSISYKKETRIMGRFELYYGTVNFPLFLDYYWTSLSANGEFFLIINLTQNEMQSLV